MTPEDARPMTAAEHLAKAEEFVRYAHDQVGRDYTRAGALAAIATAHATIAIAKKEQAR